MILEKISKLSHCADENSIIAAIKEFNKEIKEEKNQLIYKCSISVVIFVYAEN